MDSEVQVFGNGRSVESVSIRLLVIYDGYNEGFLGSLGKREERVK